MKCALSVLTLVVASALPLAARAQAAWPSHTVRIIATSPPGGSVDFLARALAEDFSRTFGTPFVVESRPGANGNIGVDLGVKAVASTGHLAMELFKSLAGVDATHVPYKGSAAQATTDLLAGRVAMSFVNTSTTLQHVRDGRLRAIAVAELKRIDAAPEIPTLAESGLPGFEATSWVGLGARSGTSREIVHRLNDRASRALAHAQVALRMRNLGIEARPMTPEQFGEFLRADTEKWADIIRRSGAKVE